MRFYHRYWRRSCIDAAKAVAVLYTNGGEIKIYVEKDIEIGYQSTTANRNPDDFWYWIGSNKCSSNYK